jgi:FecR protein
MEQHILQGVTENELLWYQRRSFLSAAATWTAMGGFGAAHAQQRSNIVELQGDAQVNGRRITPQTTLQTGDRIETGPGSTLIFVIGNASFQVRQNSRLAVERGATLNAVSVLRLLTGAVASVFGKGNNRQIITPTLTAGIRGTGVYTEVRSDQNYRSYFCNCYGVVDVAVGNERAQSVADYHQSFWAEAAPVQGKLLRPAGAINHTDEELEVLARLIQQRTNWQILGKKGTKDGKGYMDDAPIKVHPAEQPAR